MLYNFKKNNEETPGDILFYKNPNDWLYDLQF